MGRKENPIPLHDSNGQLAAMLRLTRHRSGLTFQQMATRSRLSAATFKRASCGTTVPKTATIEEFARICGANPPQLAFLLHLRTQARIEARGILHTLRAPKVHLISDRPDLSKALEYLYEAADAPPFREMQERCGNPHALPISTISRIVARETTPADERQLLAFVHGCGIQDQDKAWRAAWAKITAPDPDIAMSSPWIFYDPEEVHQRLETKLSELERTVKARSRTRVLRLHPGEAAL
ncbi:helix-turn-helix transcriptional regulator [Streptomyces lavendulae]|uniref:helix-turn-helix domain-containing protein n=1 Tax=Streptomyces lavendulae TaxID=1914 RepID=UPI00332BB6C4